MGGLPAAPASLLALKCHRTPFCSESVFAHILSTNMPDQMLLVCLLQGSGSMMSLQGQLEHNPSRLSKPFLGQGISRYGSCTGPLKNHARTCKVFLRLQICSFALSVCPQVLQRGLWYHHGPLGSQSIILAMALVGGGVWILNSMVC